MPHALYAFFSHRLEVIYDELKKQLFGIKSDTPQRHLVVVYGPAMKNWLMLKMAQDLGIAMGIEFVYLNQAFDILCQKFLVPTTLTLPSQLELALAIESEIKAILMDPFHLTTHEQHLWQPLFDYLKIENQNSDKKYFLSWKAEKRLIGLSQQLAIYFQEYGRFGFAFIEQWDKQSPSDWQQHLWQLIFNSKRNWSYPCREFKRPLGNSFDWKIHFFSISFISKAEFTFLDRLAEQVPIHYYLLSPCALFWSDIRSDKEHAYLHTYLLKKRSPESQIHQLDEFLRDRNPLLANFGRLGREMACAIEESHARTEARYIIPQHVLELSEVFTQHEDIYLSEITEPLSLLHAVQGDLLILRNPQEDEKKDISHLDLSIQLHIAPTKQREVEILYHNLLKLIDQHRFTPADIIVMTPCIADYAPYVQSVFGAKESQLDFQILDMGMQLQHSIVQSFLQLIALSESRWDAVHLLQLFGKTEFQRKFKLTQSDYYIIQEWIEKAGIRWGENVKHRNELLERQYCMKGMVDEANIGTWDYGLHRLLLGLTIILKKEIPLQLETLPYEHIDFAQSDLLGHFVRLLHSLRDDLAPLHDRSLLTMGEWADYLACLLDSYFQIDNRDLQAQEEYMDLKSQFELLRYATKQTPHVRFSFQTVKTHLDQLLQQRGLVYRENYVQTVRFCSMMPLRSIPAKVMALMGMQEGAFPRNTHASSLNLLHEAKQSDYCPSVTDLDRYLFLESLHAAQDYLLMSYQGHQTGDSKVVQPSLVIQELFSYLDQYYTIQGKAPSTVCTFSHPLDPFHSAYFQKEQSLNSYSLKDYRAACLYYQSDKRLPHRFLQDFTRADVEDDPSLVTIDIKQLSALVRNPVKFHLNHVLNIYLKEKEEPKNEESFVLSSLDKYVLTSASLKQPLDTVLLKAEKEGRLPLGLFKTVATQQIKEEVNAWHQKLAKHHIQPKDIFQIEFSVTCSTPTQLEYDYWQMPAIQVPRDQGGYFQITGTLPYVAPQGLITLGKSSFVDVWRAWPQFILFHYAADWHPDRLQRQLIATQASQAKKSFIEDPAPYLKQLIDYYQLCLHQFSPLLPEWISMILEEDVQGLQEKMRQLFQSTYQEHISHDLRWILHPYYLPDGQTAIMQWKEHAHVLVSDLLHYWYDTPVVKEEPA